jgi:hypothetical protein
MLVNSKSTQITMSTPHSLRNRADAATEHTLQCRRARLQPGARQRRWHFAASRLICQAKADKQVPDQQLISRTSRRTILRGALKCAEMFSVQPRRCMYGDKETRSSRLVCRLSSRRVMLRCVREWEAREQWQHQTVARAVGLV